MKMKEFLVTLSFHTGVPVKSLVPLDRALADHGLRAKGARGFNAPDVTPSDAIASVTMLLTHTQGANPEQSAQLVDDILKARVCKISGGLPFPELYRIQTFAEAFIYLMSNGDLETWVRGGTRAMEIGITSPDAFAYIGFSDHDLEEKDAHSKIEFQGLANNFVSIINVTKTFRFAKKIIEIGKAVRGETSDAE
jgi:hypothetical protein